MRKQAGIAILMALYVVTLVTAITIIWMLHMRVNIHRTQQMLISEKMMLDAQGGIDWEIGLLKMSNDNKWPKYMTPMLMNDNVKISGRIDDYQARLNINALSDPAVKNAFINLISLADPQINLQVATQITDSLVAANRELFSISELRMAQGITASLYLKLLPYVCALPANVPMNLTNADVILLQAFKVDRPPLESKSSEYFLAQSDATIDQQILILYALLHVQIIKGNKQVEVLWQNRGTM